MFIDKKRVKERFDQYVNDYDLSRNMIRLKVEHTYRVADLCEQIAASLKLSAEDVDLAWLIGMLHDIGRFEQQKNYGTFIDADSIDHALYGRQILFHDNRKLLREFLSDSTEDALIQTAVESHSAYRIPEEVDRRTAMFCHILRDADKIDILKVNIEFPLEEIYNVTTEELYNCQVTPEVMKSFDEEHAVLRSLKKAPVDHLVGHISLTYELVYPLSLQLMKEQGFLDKLMFFHSNDPITQEQFRHIREKMAEYMERRLGEQSATDRRNSHGCKCNTATGRPVL